MTAPSPATHGSFTLERRFDAEPGRVFAALSEIEAKARWFVGPPGWVQVERSLDFRVDGIEIAAGRFPDGLTTHFCARYEDILPGRRMVYSYRMKLGDQLISTSLATIEVEAQGDGTRLTFTEHATFLNGYEDPGAAGRKEGTSGLFDRLEASLRD